MQLQSNISDAFAKKSYFPSTIITKRQFHILMNTLIDEQKLFNQYLTNEIWRQTEQRVDNKNYIKVSQLTATLVDAIQILSNRIVQCEETIAQLSKTRNKLQTEMKYAKMQPIETKLQSVKQDLSQFEKDLKMLTLPFRKQNVNLTKQLKLASSLTRRSTVPRPQIEGPLSNRQQQKQIQLFQRRLKNLEKNTQFKYHSEDSRKCACYVLALTMVLELTVTILKFNFLNLLLFLIGFLVLNQHTFKPKMTQIALYAALFSIILDGAWLFMYSNTYLNSNLNSGLKHELKPVFQYIWFITLLQVFMKMIYAYLLRQYSQKCVQQMIQGNQADQKDPYISQLIQARHNYQNIKSPKQILKTQHHITQQN